MSAKPLGMAIDDMARAAMRLTIEATVISLHEIAHPLIPAPER